MSRHLSPGTRVRVTSANGMPGYRPGDAGTVKDGPYPAHHGGHFYLVEMDEPGEAGTIVFMTEEIEPAD